MVLAFMYMIKIETGNYMTSAKRKPKKPSLVDFTNKYANNEDAYRDFFFHAMYPDRKVCDQYCCGHYLPAAIRNNVWQCDGCGHQQYLFVGSIFQDNKLDLYKLLPGLFSFFSSNSGSYSHVNLRKMMHILPEIRKLAVFSMNMTKAKS